MVSPFDDNSLGASTPAEPASELVDALYGQHDRIREEMVAMVKEKHGLNPNRFTGEVNGDPRNGELYPDDPREQIDLITTDATSVLAEELSMQFQRAEGLRVDSLPPEPLTPTDLDSLLQRLAAHRGIDESEYEAWVPIEPEQIDNTAIGEYRAAVPGSILRFHLESEGQVASFTLLPCYETTIGFAWYVLSVTDADDELHNATIEAEEAQRLSSLLTADGDRLLETTPDRIRHASNLLGTVLHQKNPSPAPDGWLVTECQRDADASELLAPRYAGTFIHKESEIVLEVLPEPADNPFKNADAGPAEEQADAPVQQPNDPSSAYQWEISFAPDYIHDELTDSFDKQVAGEDFTRMMTTINNLLD